MTHFQIISTCECWSTHSPLQQAVPELLVAAAAAAAAGPGHVRAAPALH